MCYVMILSQPACNALCVGLLKAVICELELICNINKANIDYKKKESIDLGDLIWRGGKMLKLK